MRAQTINNKIKYALAPVPLQLQGEGETKNREIVGMRLWTPKLSHPSEQLSKTLPGS